MADEAEATTTVERPVPVRVSAKLIESLEHLIELDGRISRARQRVSDLEDERDVIRKRVGKRLQPGWWRAGPFILRRTIVPSKPSIDAWQAIADGVVTEDALRPFMKDRAISERWTLKRSKTPAG